MTESRPRKRIRPIPAPRSAPTPARRTGVGIDFNAITFSGQDQGIGQNVRGFAIGNRGDTFVDPVTGQVIFSGAYGIPDPANILFEFEPDTGTAISPPNVADKTKGRS